MEFLRIKTARRRGMSGARRPPFGAVGMREESPEVRRRARVVIGLSALGLAAVAAIATVILVNSASVLMSRAADQRAQHGVGLLVSVGHAMPDLTPGLLKHGMSAADASRLDAAVRHEQQAGLLSDLRLWDARGKLIYAGDENLEQLSPSLDARDLAQMLHGRSVINRDSSGLDLSSGRNTGTLDAFEPLRDSRGHVYGAVETDLPLRPVLAEDGALRNNILFFGIAGSALLWLLVLPFTARAALGIARAWIPGGATDPSRLPIRPRQWRDRARLSTSDRPD